MSIVVKKCPDCGNNTFNAVFDTVASLVCTKCQLVFQAQHIKRLPEDKDATNQIRISIPQSECKQIVLLDRR